jgi:hypothetical protein
MRELKRNRRWRHSAVYSIGALALLLLSQRPLLPRPGIEISQIRLENAADRATALPSEGIFEEAGRSFRIRPDQQGISERDEKDLGFKWEREFGSIVTAAAVSQNLSAWGLLDGRVFLLDRDGSIVRVIDPKLEGVDSSYPCIYALALSDQGEALAVLFGILPQQVLVYERSSGFYSLSYSKPLMKDLRSTQSATFSRDGKSLLIKTADGLVYYDRDARKGALLHPELFAGEEELLIKDLELDGFAILKDSDGGRYAGILRHGALEAYFSVPNDSYGLVGGENSFTVKEKERELVFSRRDYE